jgi:hypothetical protein
VTTTTSGLAPFMVELVIDVRGPMPLAELALRGLTARLEAQRALRVGQVATVVSQEFGRLTCTVRVLLEARELLEATDLAVQAVRPLLVGANQPGAALTFHETGLHSRPL